METGLRQSIVFGNRRQLTGREQIPLLNQIPEGDLLIDRRHTPSCRSLRLARDEQGPAGANHVPGELIDGLEPFDADSMIPCQVPQRIPCFDRHWNPLGIESWKSRHEDSVVLA